MMSLPLLRTAQAFSVKTTAVVPNTQIQLVTIAVNAQMNISRISVITSINHSLTYNM